MDSELKDHTSTAFDYMTQVFKILFLFFHQSISSYTFFICIDKLINSAKCNSFMFVEHTT